MTNVEQRFHQHAQQLCREAQTQCGCDARRQLQLIGEHGAVQAAKILLAPPSFPDRLLMLHKHGRLDLSVEVNVLKDPWRQLFTVAELTIARRRLADLGWPEPEEPEEADEPEEAEEATSPSDEAAHLQWIRRLDPIWWTLRT